MKYLVCYCSILDAREESSPSRWINIVPRRKVGYHLVCPYVSNECISSVINHPLDACYPDEHTWAGVFEF